MTTVEAIRSKKDIEKVKEVLKNDNERNFLLFIMGINCGLRISDKFNLKTFNFKIFQVTLR